MKYAIVENEYHCMEHLKNMLSDLRPEWQLLFIAETVEEVISQLSKPELPDLIFMDIELNDGNSFSVFKKIRINIPIIFTTAYDEYCLQAFKVYSIDYLLKPITINTLLFAIRKYENFLVHEDERFSKYEKLNNVAIPEQPQVVRILISYRDTYKFLTSDLIAWFVNEDKYVFAVDKEGVKHFTTFSTLGEVEEVLPQKEFFRVTRSTIVSINCINEVKKSFKYKLFIVVRAGKTSQKIDISMAKKKDFLAWFGHGKA